MNYILTTKTESELYHHGVKGMKWGVRRFQRKDGTLTKAGVKRYNKELEKAKSEAKKLKEAEQTKKKLAKLDSLQKDNENRKKALKTDKPHDIESKGKKLSDMTDDELRSKINRMQMEQTYLNMSPKHVSKGKKFVDTVTKNVIVPAAEEIGKQVVKSLLTRAINKAIKDESLKVHTNNKRK